MNHASWVRFFGNLRTTSANATAMVFLFTAWRWWQAPTGGPYFVGLLLSIVLLWVAFFASMQKAALLEPESTEASRS